MKKLAIFISGSGTNMENLIKVSLANQLTDAQVTLVICDQPGAGGIQKAEKLGVPVKVVDRTRFNSKKEFEAHIFHIIEDAGIDHLVLAGYMRILSNDFVRRYMGRIINIHPSLLPAFPGAHGIKDAFDAKVKETGVTVHFVDEGVDTGPIILQRKVAVTAAETLESLEAKVHAVEYELYPEALNLVLSGKIKMPGHHHDEEFWDKD